LNGLIKPTLHFVNGVIVLNFRHRHDDMVWAGSYKCRDSGCDWSGLLYMVPWRDYAMALKRVAMKGCNGVDGVAILIIVYELATLQ
jgi:hypothetical protein